MAVTIGAAELSLCVGVALIVLVASALKARTAGQVFAVLPAVVYLGGGSAVLVREVAVAASLSMLIAVGVGKLLHVGSS